MKNLIFETRNIERIEDYPFYIPKCGVNIYGKHSVSYKGNFTFYKMDHFGMLIYPNINNTFILNFLKIP